MNPQDAFTDFSKLQLPERETEMSRRYLQVICRWIPVGMSYFNEWPGRPRCGHFFGGVLWYGQETAMSAATFAVAASSREFDEALAGISADEARQVALKGLRYLCFVHDTGPEDCVRPEESWGRTEPAGTKWGERGGGFFRESQCGRTISGLALTAALLKDLLSDEENEMLANIAADYMERFDTMEPKAGVYNDTQTEENAWTALGIIACILLLPDHERADAWMERAKLWQFRTTTLPRDAHDSSVFAEGRTIRELTGRTFTTLPDGTAENHGFVHPSYMASALSLHGMSINLLKLFGTPVPPHMFWRRKESYDLLKRWCDDTGAPHCVQGMDWPYFAYQGECFFHAAASHYLKDSDAALLEEAALQIVERSSLAHNGRMVPEETVEHCHGQQDPSLMRERMVSMLAHAYLVHRLSGEGAAPPDTSDFRDRMNGVYVYPHGGALLHKHNYGITSLSWRNRTMLLPAPRDGLKSIGPETGSMLARICVQGKVSNCEPVITRIREGEGCAAAAIVEDLAEGSARRQLFFASLPDGRCISAERLIANEDITVESVCQGVLCIINDGMFGEHGDLRGHRRVFWSNGQKEFIGYVSDDAEDLCVELNETRWVNVDHQFGFVFRGSGKTFYRNPHHFKVWHAIKDNLVLSEQSGPQSFMAGDEIALLIALWCPHQTAEETAEQQLGILDTPEHVMAARVDGWLCGCNFGDSPFELPFTMQAKNGLLPECIGAVRWTVASDRYCPQLLTNEPALVQWPDS
ncbi:MAG: hypothetical protein QF473_07670 [Planctomycetota bacterium]|jgi:hypothetical protein|nr:hypothetical protein [Planctomycetota bacterium]